jgi:hypothetical protein
MRRRIGWARAGKWAGAGIATLIFAAWAASGWWFVDWGWGPGRVRTRVLLVAGCVYVERVSAPSPSFNRPPWPGDLSLRSRGAAHLSAPCWWWQSELYTVNGPSPGAIPGGPFPAGSFSTEVTVPLWAPFVGAAGLAVACWRLDRRRPPGACPKCGYDLKGNTTGVCPECGRAA